MLLTLEAQLTPKLIPTLPDGYQMRPTLPTDVDALGRIYFTAYEPGIACETESEAIADMQLWLSGGYGEAWLAASPVVTIDDSIASTVQVVRSAPWANVPDGPSITEVFTDRAHRHQGLAKAAMIAAMAALLEAGETSVSLRVLATNPAARRLYGSLGFRSWSPT